MAKASGVVEPRLLFETLAKSSADSFALRNHGMKSLLPEGAIWSAFGISRWQMEIVALSTILGGHCRVGLEDNIYLERGVFATNAQLVERAARIIRDLGCEVATPDEAREILGLRA